MLFDTLRNSPKEDLWLVTTLLKYGADAIGKDNDGNTPLHCAAARGYLNSLHKLLANDARVNMPNNKRQTALHLAAEMGFHDVVRALLAHKANVNAASEDNETPLHLAALKNRLQVVKRLLIGGALTGSKNMNGKNALHLATSLGYVDIVHDLLCHSAVVDERDAHGATALFLASEQGHAAVVNLLLKSHADENARNEKGETPLHIATKNNHFDVVEELLDYKAAVDLADNDECTALYWAALYGYYGIAQALVSPQASYSTSLDAFVNKADKDGQTPLYWAARSKYIEVLKLLLDSGAHANMLTKRGRTALHWASNFGHLDIVQLLQLTSHKEGRTPLYYASIGGYLDIFELLFNDGAVAYMDTKEASVVRDQTSYTVNKMVKKFETPINLRTAIEHIHKKIIAVQRPPWEIVTIALSIYTMALDCPVHRQDVLEAGLMVARLIRHLQRCSMVDKFSNLLPALREFEIAVKNTVSTSQATKLRLADIPKNPAIKLFATRISAFQTSLQKMAKHLNISLNIQVIGTYDDLRNNIGNMMEKMDIIENCLQNIAYMPDHESKDKMDELELQMIKGFLRYQRQVAFCNITSETDFEVKFQKCRSQINDFMKVIERQSNRFITLMSEVDLVNTWMISSDDVDFCPEDLQTLLGEGGFGKVFSGKYQGQPVAVKQFMDSSIDSADFEKAITKEIKAWQSISHEPHILTLVGVCTKISHPILVSELCRTNIRRYVRDHRDILILMIYQFAKGLATLHKANIIHRDLKGDNVLVTFQGIVVIADFGLSRAVTSLHHTKSTVAGTLNWMSPEQFLNARNVTSKSDVWSFGMSLWEILCNEIPFYRCSENEFRTEIFTTATDRPEKPQNLDSTLEPLWSLITKCWLLDPEARPSAEEIVKHLESEYGFQVKKSQ
ncbi:hypothetical protein AeMF1_021784 [Aphanomyces euteiches]|nr:hypothetical protein AeMF1_021784 [Aphanomyces euteiches]KAH9193003.1 hypothetical protein AeNC1_005023 [Aphanomyces euteiches]